MRSKPQQPLPFSKLWLCSHKVYTIPLLGLPLCVLYLSPGSMGVPYICHSCIPFSVIYFLLANAHNNFLLQLIILFNKPSLLKLQYFPGAMSISSIQILVSKYDSLMAHSRTEVGKTQSETGESYSSRK